ncbi:MAG TPA: DUF3618 domain-containing protein [Nocardioidaceae bacterium]|nr:DUF3618 domain-containing protein [Nocardioidaceae bacterium]
MGQGTEEQLTTNIERTRQDLSRDLDALHDRVSPHQVMERRKAATRSRLHSLKEKVMGTAHEARHSASSTGSSITDTASGAADSVSGTAHDAVGTLEHKTEGNPLAAGLIAFGTGVLISSLVPASDKEQQASQRLVDEAKEHGSPVMDEARSAGQQMGADLKEHATEAAQEVRATAQDSTEHVKAEGEASAQHVKDDAQQKM